MGVLIVMGLLLVLAFNVVDGIFDHLEEDEEAERMAYKGKHARRW